MVGGKELKVQHGQRLKIGVLALQGAVVEHCRMLESLGVIVVEVRLPKHLALLDGLIIPGGESTSMGLIAERWGLIEPLRSWVRSGRPTWGICAGMILLADSIEDQKQGGQPFIGGMEVEVNRNYFGRQINSFEAMLNVSNIADFYEAEKPYQAVFIRAPIITEVRNGVIILASIMNGLESKLIVAARQKLMMVTAFHPELTDDLRWHQLFLNMVDESRTTLIHAT
jgi:5'-phosphate synthase pdxT subunit